MAQATASEEQLAREEKPKGQSPWIPIPWNILKQILMMKLPKAQPKNKMMKKNQQQDLQRNKRNPPHQSQLQRQNHHLMLIQTAGSILLVTAVLGESTARDHNLLLTHNTDATPASVSFIIFVGKATRDLLLHILLYASYVSTQNLPQPRHKRGEK